MFLSTIPGLFGIYNIPGAVEWSGSIVSLLIVWVMTNSKTDVGMIAAFDFDLREKRAQKLFLQGIKYGFLIIGIQVAISAIIMICLVGSGSGAPDEPAYRHLLGWKNNGEFVAKFSLVALLAPISEELLARGLLFAGLRKRRGFWFSCLVSSSLFGLGHVYPVHIALAFVLGIMLCTVVEKTRSLLPGLVCHVMLNSFVMGALLLVSLYAPAETQKAKKEASETVQTETMRQR